MATTVQTETIVVTPQMAEDWLEHNHFEQQRKRRPRHVDYLAGELKAGRFRKGTVIEFGVLKGRAYIVNGQHTLAAVVQSGISIELVIVRQTVQTEDALARLYNTHDSGLPRTWVDAYAAMGLNQRWNMTDSEITAYGRAAPYIAGEFTQKGVREALANRSKDLRINTMETHHEAAKQYFACLSEAEPPIRKALLLPPMLALGTYTLFHAKEAAEEFWSLAADDQNLSKTDPPKVTTILAQRIERRTQKALVGLGQSVIGAWNASVLGKEVKTPKLIKNPTDIVRIFGTPLAEPAQESMLPVDEDPEVEKAEDEVMERAREVFGEDMPLSSEQESAIHAQH